MRGGWWCWIGRHDWLYDTGSFGKTEWRACDSCGTVQFYWPWHPKGWHG